MEAENIFRGAFVPPGYGPANYYLFSFNFLIFDGCAVFNSRFASKPSLSHVSAIQCSQVKKCQSALLALVAYLTTKISIIERRTHHNN